MDIVEQLSQALADRLTQVAPAIVAVMLGSRHVSGILWGPDAVATSEEAVGEHESTAVRHGGTETGAKLAGRDPATNIAVFRLSSPLSGQTLVPAAAPPRPGSLALVAGADAAGAPTGRLAMIHATGPAWHSMAGGLIDSSIRLDVRLGFDEGGAVLDASGALLGMAAAGPRRRGMVIPTATLARVVPRLLTDGRIPRGYLGVGLQSVTIAEKFREVSGQARGAMVLQLAGDSAADRAGILPGDILLAVDGHRFGQSRRIPALMDPDRIGQSVAVRLLRGATAMELNVALAARPV